MLNSKIQFLDNKPLININNILYPPLAYTTYFDECGDWENFSGAGYKMFFVNLSFNTLPINNTTGFTPFRTGVFESRSPDYSEFERTVNKILSSCPSAFIFPRIHISMPRTWIKDNPYETVPTPKGGNRESLFSDKFRRDGAESLKKVLEHIKNADYSNRIAGYQLCGGTTQEWIHPDLSGSYSEMGMIKFREWAKETHGIENIATPTKNDFFKDELTPEASLYYRFCSEKVAETIEHFAKVTKDFTGNKQIVGVFYGYNGFVRDPLWGLHGLGKIIDSPYIDFFSSPCCYDDARNLGLDWGDMLPIDSVKLHRKLCFIECDIRTHLTRRMQDSRPDEYPEDIMSLVNDEGKRTVWKGPETPEHSISAIRKAFSHQLIKSSGIWWFDMWGGWYRDTDIMNELSEMRCICEKSTGERKTNTLCAETALFIDEGAYANAPRTSQITDAVNIIRVAMGNTGIPFDTYMVEDAKTVLSKYKAAIFTTPIPTQAGLNAVKYCKDNNIPYILPTKDKYFFSTDELRSLLTEMGIHCYNKDNNVIYCSNGYLAIHTKNEGETTINLPRKMKMKPLLPKEATEEEVDTITINKPQYSTLLFEI